jgi:hypothetical protein
MASASATEDQASDHTVHDKAQRAEFDTDVTEAAPTNDQLKSILEYIGVKNAGQVVKGASGEAEAIKKVGENGDNFLRPVVGSLVSLRKVEGS